MIKKYVPYFIALVTFSIPIYIYYTPPTDSDGGPMMAYNFFFFYPLLLLTMVLSAILLSIGYRAFKKHKITGLVLFISTIPTFCLLGLVIFSHSLKEYKYEEPVDMLNGFEKVQVNKNLELTLTGYTYKEIRKKITFTPASAGTIEYTRSNFCQGDFHSFFLYYAIKNDSIYIYIPDNEPLYYTEDRLRKLPIKIFQIHQNAKDSLELLTQNNRIRKFTWK